MKQFLQSLKKPTIIFGAIGVLFLIAAFAGDSSGTVPCVAFGAVFLLIAFIIQLRYSKRVAAPPRFENAQVAEPRPPEPVSKKQHLSYTDLNFEKVLNRYLTSRHSTCPSEFDYREYFISEFDCILKNLNAVKINLSDSETARRKALDLDLKFSALTKSTSIKNIKNFVAIDTETTGLRATSGDIIELSAIKFVDFRPVDIFTTLIKPRKPIPEDVTKINGITNDIVADAPSFAQINNALIDFIGSFPIVAHNAEFDLNFLYTNGLDINFAKTRVFDTLDLSRKNLRDYENNRLENYKLATACGECCIYFSGAHRASADALACGLLFVELIKHKKETENVLSLLDPYAAYA